MQAIESTSTIQQNTPDAIGVAQAMGSVVATASDNLPAIMPGQAIDFSHLTENTSITLKSGDRDYTLTARDLIRWKAPGAPVSDAVKLLVIAQNTGLDPMLDEIELINFGGKWQVSIRKNGYVKVAKRSKDFDGHESGLVIQPTDESRPPKDVMGTVTPNGWKIVGGWCKVYTRGISRPVYKAVDLDNYDRKSGTWKSNPAVMIEKVAIAQAFRESFPIGESYDDAEMPVQREIEVAAQDANPTVSRKPLPIRPEVIEPTPPKAQSATPAPVVPAITDFEVVDVELDDEQPFPGITDSQVDAICRLTESLDMNDTDFAKMLAKRGVSTIEGLTGVQAIEIIGKLAAIVDRKNLNPNA